MTLRRLRAHGVPASVVAERCRPGGPWRQLLPQVYLLRPGAPGDRERLRAALLYAGREPGGRGNTPGGAGASGPAGASPASSPSGAPGSSVPSGPAPGGGREAMVTGLAALALHGFACVPPLSALLGIDVLVPRQRRLRDAGEVTVHRARVLPPAQEVAGLPCAPVPRALADTVGSLDDARSVRRLLAEAVRGGYCDAAAVMRELGAAGLLDHPHVADAVGALHGADRRVAEQRLYAMVRNHALPDPVWNVELRLPGGPPLGAVDAYWPDHGVALAIDPRHDGPDPYDGPGTYGPATYGPGAYDGAATDDGVAMGHSVAMDGDATGDLYADPYGGSGSWDTEVWQPETVFRDDEVWSRTVRQRDRLEALGITLVHVTPAELRDACARQAAVVRTALVAAADQLAAAYVVVTPR
ncbi:hypothetical protein [Streptomyces sp. NRRL F-5123]|uniref:hypothetical protein n=1 Tax=Streptomyces sp. NRRL F-5123 TaxID=1463856 RepID=UPI0005BAF23B|nr:hypothetical protein [Streptomyces sp. NRRL F-5123]